IPVHSLSPISKKERNIFVTPETPMNPPVDGPTRVILSSEAFGQTTSRKALHRCRLPSARRGPRPPCPSTDFPWERRFRRIPPAADRRRPSLFLFPWF